MVGLSVAIWSIEVVVYVLVGAALGLELAPVAMVLVMCVLTLGLVAPSAPGFVGVFEAAIIQTTTLYGTTGSLAVAFAVTMHLIHYVPGTLLGLIFAWKSGLKLGELRSGRGAYSPEASTP